MNNVGRAEILKKARNDTKNTKGYKRIISFLDEGSFNEIDSLAKSGDGYAEAVAGYGVIDGCPVYVFSQNSDINGGAMSKAQASKLKKLYQLAVKTGVPIVGIYDSIGARLSEGADMLSAYGEILLNSNNLSGVVPQISIILGPCTGTSAMIAAGADIVIMSDKGELTIGTDGNGGSEEEAAKLGVCQIAAKDEVDAIQTARKLISILPSNNLESAAGFEETAAASNQTITTDSDVKQIISSVCDSDSFIEFGEVYGIPTVTGIAQIGGFSVGIVSLKGVIGADSCSKAARFMRFCDSFSIPVITFVDAEKFATLREASKLSSAYSEATTAKITVITGSAYGSIYIAVAGRGANADYTTAWPQATVSALAPETAAIFLWNDRLANSKNPVEDRKKLIEEYKTTEATPFSAADDGIIEDIVNPDDTRAKITANLDMLSGKRVSTIPKKHTNIQL